MEKDARPCAHAILKEEAGLVGIHVLTVEDSDFIRKVLREVADTIVGALERRISPTVDFIGISLPSIIAGAGHRLLWNGAKKNLPRFLLPFSVDDRTFCVELLYDNQ